MKKHSPLSRILSKNYHKHPRFFFLISVFLIFIGIFILWISTFKIPDLNSFEQRKVAQSTKIFDRTEKILLYDVHQGSKRTSVPFGDISVFIKNATVAIEDSDFYNHNGIKITSIIRAILANFVGGGYTQGGSTITQQVVKNSLLTQDKTISRKMKEWVLALKIDRILSKEEILSIYLNETSYGGNLYGVEEASKKFFAKSAKDVTLAESAYIAAIPQATSYFSPYGANRAKLEARKNLVLKRMKDLSFINDGEYKNALSEQVVFQPQDNYGILAPHFVMFVKDILEQKYGQDMVENGGLKVITTLDYSLEQKAEEVLKRKAIDNKKNFNAENLALVAIDPKTGEILSMVGSKDYFDKEIDGNFNVATAHRQPGSTFKPIVYAEAFIKGYTPETVLFDLQTEFDSQCDPKGKPTLSTTAPSTCYMPENYDSKFRGPITLRNALAQSINIPSIKTLYLAGIKDSLTLARNLGIATLGDSNQYGLTLVLGGGEVSLLDITSAYGVFANDGVRNPYQAILSVADSQGNTLFSKNTNPVQVVPQEVARTISDILNDDDARAPAYGRNSMLYFKGYDVAVKTGTTNDYKDAWTIGFTPNIVLGLWAGNNNNSPMEKKVAGQIIAPIWNEVMRYALNTYPQQNFKKPTADYSDLKPILRGIWQGGKTYVTDTVSGKLATEFTPEETKKINVIREVHSILYWINKNDPNGPKPGDPTRDAQFTNWETPIREWALLNNYGDESDFVIPTESDNIHTTNSSISFGVGGISEGESFSVKTSISLTIYSSGGYSMKKAYIYINGDLISTITQPPFQTTINLDSVVSLKESSNEMRIIVYDQIFNKSEKIIKFNAIFN